MSPGTWQALDTCNLLADFSIPSKTHPGGSIFFAPSESLDHLKTSDKLALDFPLAQILLIFPIRICDSANLGCPGLTRASPQLPVDTPPCPSTHSCSLPGPSTHRYASRTCGRRRRRSRTWRWRCTGDSPTSHGPPTPGALMSQ